MTVRSHDSFYTIGSHIRCDDYALSSESIAVVCDGCGSLSDDQCNVGSRIIANLAINNEPLIRCLTVAEILGLPKESLYSTLVKVESFDGFINFSIQGDGSILASTPDGYTFITLRHLLNCPYYPYYDTNPFDKMQYEQIVGYLYEKEIIQLDKQFRFLSKETSQCMPKIEAFYEEVPGPFLVFTDGIGSFINDTGDKIKPEDILSKLLDFKSLTGKFLERKCNKMLSVLKECGYYNHDDFSVAGFYCE